MNTADKIQACIANFDNVTAQVNEFINTIVPANGILDTDNVIRLANHNTQVSIMRSLPNSALHKGNEVNYEDEQGDTYNKGTMEYYVHNSNLGRIEQPLILAELLLQAEDMTRQINEFAKDKPVIQFVSSKEDRQAAEQAEQLKAIDLLLQNVVLEDGKWLRTGKSKPIIRPKHNLPLGNHIVTADDKKVYTLTVNSQDYFEISRTA